MKKIFLLLAFFSVAEFTYGARYWVGGGSSSNWNATSPTNWSDVSGGSNNFSVPGSTDDVIFDGALPNGNASSIISAAITIKSWTITSGYTATSTHNAVLTIKGNITLQTGVTFAGGSGIGVSAAGTWTSNGKTWPNSFNIGAGSFIYTLADAWTIGGSLTTTNSVGTNATMNGYSMTVGGGLTIQFASILGTTDIILNGTGTWSKANDGWIRNDLEIATTGTITVSGTVAYTAGTLKYTLGTVSTANSTLKAGSPVTLNTGGSSVPWNNVTFLPYNPNAGSTATFSSTLTVNGTLTYSSTNYVFFSGGDIDASGNITVSNSSASASGGGTTNINIIT